ncbi:MAG: hypothetical protein H6712_03545 [Myxococcales bacterium]|nr:hypothetical protein [Myxococcales bacterium]MCB9712901.1 hypothetical protein [Myxococcales bacterium]
MNRNVYSFPGDTSYVILPRAPVSDQGLTLELWVRRRGDAPLQCILELMGEDGDRLAIESDEDPADLVLVRGQGEPQRIPLPGALPADRWTLVRLRVEADGSCELSTDEGWEVATGQVAALPAGGYSCRLGSGRSAGSFDGYLADLCIGFAPVLERATAWGFFAFDELRGRQVWGEQYGQPHRLLGDSIGVAVVSMPAPCPGRPDVLHLDRDARVDLAPLRSLKGALTLEAWVRLDDLQGRHKLLRVGDGTRGGAIRLVAKGSDLALTFWMSGNGGDLCLAPGVLHAGRWTHVTATLDLHGASTLYVRGEPVATGAPPEGWSELGLVGLTKFEFGAVRSKLRQAEVDGTLTRQHCGLGLRTLLRAENIDSVCMGEDLQGQLAEVCLWTKLRVASAIAQRWSWRRRGTEDRLAACYRLDRLDGQRVEDNTPHRADALLVGTGEIVSTTGLPSLVPTRGEGTVQTRTRGSLMLEWLPLAPLQDYWRDRLGDEATDVLVAKEIHLRGHREGERVRCRVYECVLEPRSHAGTGMSGKTLEISADDECIAVLDQAEQTLLATWPKDQVQRVVVGSSGRVRLRFLTRSLSCPSLRFRIDDEEFFGVWTPVRPDQELQRTLRGLRGSDLLAPPDGRESPLPSNGATPEDADALATALSALAGVVVREPTPPTATPRGGLGKLRHFVDDAADAVEEGIDAAQQAIQAAIAAAEEAARQAEEEARRAMTELQEQVRAGGLLLESTVKEELLDRAERVEPFAGAAALAARIDVADALAVVVPDSGDLMKGLQIIGQIGAGAGATVWRFVVNTAEDAWAGMTAIVEKAGAAIRSVLEALAGLFGWKKFLAASDFIHDEMVASAAGLRGLFAEGQLLRSGWDELASIIDGAVGTPSGSTSGPSLDIDVSISTPPELDYLLGQVERLLESNALSIDFDMANLLDVDIDILDEEAIVGAIASLPFASIISDPLGAPLDILASIAQTLWSLARSGIEGLFAALDGMVDGLVGAAQARIVVPWITDLVEDLVLSVDDTHRDLTLLRLISLIAAIPLVLSGWDPDDEMVSFSAEPTDNQRRRTVTYYTATSTINTLLVSIRGTFEVSRGQPLPYSVLCLHAGVLIFLSDASRKMAQLEDDAKVQATMATTAALDTATCLWTAGLAARMYHLGEERNPEVKLEKKKRCGDADAIYGLASAVCYTAPALAGAILEQSNNPTSTIYWVSNTLLRSLQMVNYKAGKTIPAGVTAGNMLGFVIIGLDLGFMIDGLLH